MSDAIVWIYVVYIGGVSLVLGAAALLLVQFRSPEVSDAPMQKTATQIGIAEAVESPEIEDLQKKVSVARTKRARIRRRAAREGRDLNDEEQGTIRIVNSDIRKILSKLESIDR